MSSQRVGQRTSGRAFQRRISDADFSVRYSGEDQENPISDLALRGRVSVSKDELVRREYYTVTVTLESEMGFDWPTISPSAHELMTCTVGRDTFGRTQTGVQYDLTVSPPGRDSVVEEQVCLGQHDTAEEMRTQQHEFRFQAPNDAGSKQLDITVDLHARDDEAWGQFQSYSEDMTVVASTETVSRGFTVTEFDIDGKRSLKRLTGEKPVSARTLAGDQGLDTDPLSFRKLLGALVQGARGEPPEFVDTRWSNWVGESNRPDVLERGEQRKLFRPEDRDELLSGMKYLVEVEGKQIRAVGSGHSHSKAPAPREHYVDITELKATSPEELLDQPWLKSAGELDVETEHLVRVPAGTVLKQLNRDVLAPAGLALENMGSFDGQTLAGAVNTGTHGTGIDLETVADMVKSVEMVAVEERGDGEPEVKLLRVEPSDGITDSTTSPGRMELIQDDETFYSVVAGFGCMGIAVAYTMRVRDAYWLKEESTLMQWSELRGRLQTDEVNDRSDVPEFIGENRHIQMFVNLPEVHNSDDPDPECLVRTHEVVPAEDVPEKPNDWEALVDNAAGDDNKLLDVSDGRWPPERRKTTVRDIGSAGAFHPLKDWTVWDVLGLGPGGWAGQLRTFFFNPEANREPFVKKREKTASYIALRRPRDRGNFPPKAPQPAISTDIAVPLDKLVETVEDVFEEADSIEQTHEVDPVWRKFARTLANLFGASGPEPKDVDFNVRFGVPMGIRFTAPSDHPLSGAYDEWSAMVEVPFPVKAANANALPQVPNLSEYEIREEVATPALNEIETTIIDRHGGRPHLGKTNSLDAETLSRLYTVETDRGSRDVFDGEGGWMETYERFNAFGTFDNAFTDQLGISNRSTEEE